MEYNTLPDPIVESAGDSTLTYEFTLLSENRVYTLINRYSGLVPDIPEIDTSKNIVYHFSIYRDFVLRESTDRAIPRSHRMFVEDGYVIYNLDNQSLSFCNIHRTEGTAHERYVTYINRLINDEIMFVPLLISYGGDDGLEITYKLDQDANIVQVYNDIVPMVSRQTRTLGLCTIPGSSPPDHDSGTTIIGSKNIDIMTGLSYILSIEITQLRRIGEEMVERGLIDNYIIY